MIQVVGVGVPGGKLVAAGDSAIQGVPGAFGGPVDGDVKIGLGVVDGDGGRALEAYFDAATLVDAASWTIDIGKSHHDTQNDIAGMIQGICQPLGDMVAQAFGESKVVGMYLDLHFIPHSEQGDWIMGIPIIRYKQIIVR